MRADPSGQPILRPPAAPPGHDSIFARPRQHPALPHLVIYRSLAPPRRPGGRRSSVRTFSPKPADVERAWHVIDADGLVLGRLSTEVARLLRGKHKPTFSPHIDMGDHVVVVNAAKVVLTSDKAEKKLVYRHSGYPGGLRSRPYGEIIASRPEEAVFRSVRGMMPRGPLGRKMLKKLKVYSGPTHPHAAQSPGPVDLSAARRLV